MPHLHSSLPILLAILMSAGSIYSVKAQVAHGQVFDRENNIPLTGAEITTQEPGLETVTDENGRFRIEFPAPGAYPVRISHLGYETRTDTVRTDHEEAQVFYLQAGAFALTEAVVTATRYAVRNFYAPGFLSPVSKREIRERGGRSSAELLIGAPGVWVQKTNHGGGSPFIRGLTGNQTLAMLDGIRLNNATYRYGPNQYFNTLDALGIASVEILRGGGSVLYGSDALGGAINVLTPTPHFSGDGRQWGGSVTGRFMTGDMEKSTRLTVRSAGERIAFLAGFSYRDFGDLIAGGNLGKEAPSGYREMAGDFKGLFKTGSQGLLTVAYNGIRQSEVGRYDQVAERGYELYQFDPQSRELGYVKYQFGSSNDWFKEVKMTASFQQSLEGRQKKRVDIPAMQDETDKVNTLGLSVEVHAAPAKDLKMVTGVEYYRDGVQSEAFDKEIETGDITLKRGLYPDGSRADNMAVYTSQTWSLNKVQLNAGGRFNTVRIAIEDEIFGDTKISPSAFVWNASARYAIHRHHAVFFNTYTGFRAPNINDLSSFGSFDFGIEVPSFDLQPEKSFTLEAGYKISGKRIEGDLSLYHMRLDNLITRVRSTYKGSGTYQGEDVYTKENTAQALVQGVESSVRINLTGQLSFTGNLTYTYGQDKTKEEPMRRIPPLFGRTALIWRHPKGFYLQAEHLFAGAQTRLSGGDIDDHRIREGGTPGWNVVNLNAGYEWNWLTINAGLQNLANEAYRIHGSGVDGVGRSGWLSAMMSF